MLYYVCGVYLFPRGSSIRWRSAKIFKICRCPPPSLSPKQMFLPQNRNYHQLKPKKSPRWECCPVWSTPSSQCSGCLTFRKRKRWRINGSRTECIFLRLQNIYFLDWSAILFVNPFNRSSIVSSRVLEGRSPHLLSKRWRISCKGTIFNHSICLKEQPLFWPSMVVTRSKVIWGSSDESILMAAHPNLCNPCVSSMQDPHGLHSERAPLLASRLHVLHSHSPRRKPFFLMFLPSGLPMLVRSIVCFIFHAVLILSRIRWEARQTEKKKGRRHTLPDLPTYSPNSQI